MSDEKDNKGLLDKSYVHRYLKSKVDHNINEVIENKESHLHKLLQHLKKLLFAFKLVNYHHVFPEMTTNLSSRNAELTHPLLRMFLWGPNFEKIRFAQSKIIYEKTNTNNNSVESKLTESLKILIENEENKGKHVVDISLVDIYLVDIYNTFKIVTQATDYSYNFTNSTSYLPDGTTISKKEISKILVSKFRAKSHRTNQNRGPRFDKKDIKK